jgi:hypothetical protein
MRSLLIVCLASTAALGQTPPIAQSPSRSGQDFDRRQFDNIDDAEKVARSWWPHPYATVEFSAMPGGYAPVAAYGELGGDVERAPWLAHAHFGYDNGHKTNDDDQPNPKGHDRYLNFSGYWRLRHHTKWFAGGGWRWSQLSTTNYTKGGSRPFFGGGYDLFFDHQGRHPDCGGYCWGSARFTLNYFTAGTDRQNGSHGVDVGFIMPRPVEKRHIFFVSDFLLFRANETVTEPADVPLTQQQKADKFFDGSASFGIMYRFH